MNLVLSLLYDIYFCLNHHRKWYIQDGHLRCRVASFAQFFYKRFDWFLNNSLVNYYKNHPVSITPKRKQKVIVSLTSFPARINTTWIAIESIFHQSVKPDKIILWLAETQFKNRYDDLPKELIDQQGRGLEIRFCDDIKSHKKYYYTMQEYPKELVVLFDDDGFYPHYVIKDLLRWHRKFPGAIIGFSSYKPYPKLSSKCSQWIPNTVKKRVPTWDTQCFSGQGTLWPPNSLDRRVFNKEMAIKLTPYADDLWLYVMMLLNNTKAYQFRKHVDFPHEIGRTQEDSLFAINGTEGKNQNDIQWMNLMDRYGDELKSLYPYTF